MKKPTRKSTRPPKAPTSSTPPAPPKKNRRKQPRTQAKRRPSSRTDERGARRSRVRLRRVLPGTTWFITKKTNDDQFLLRPDGTADPVLLYSLIDRLTKHGLLLHEFVFMSNHFHLVITDVRGTLPAFMREFLSETGKALKVALKTTRRIWSGDRYGSTTLLDVDAAERLMTYTRVNPTAAGLTAPEEWPGLTSARWSYGDTIEAIRPDEFFDPRTRRDQVSCILEPLPEQFGEAQVPRAEVDKERTKSRRRCLALQKKIDRRTRAKVVQIHEQRRGSQDSAPRGLADLSTIRNASRQKRGNHEYGRLNPRFATRDPDRLLAAVEDERSFLAVHEQARKRFLGGEQKVLFPSGTYGYRELWGVRVKKGGAAA